MKTMAETTVKKREWVKNAAIIFLSVMLVLTFFSNTFMNHSLPEVSTQYVMSGSINAKIRGSGTVTANEEYVVETEQSRKIETVFVQVGQTVAAGDVLFILGEGDSAELDAAKETLDDMELAYQIELLSIAEESYYSERAAIDSARKDLENARKEAAALKPTVTGSSAAVSAAEKAYNDAVSAKAEAEKAYNEAVEKLEVLTGGNKNEPSGEDEIPSTIEANAEAIIRYQGLYAEAKSNYEAMIAERDKYDSASEEFEKYDKSATEWKKAMESYDAMLLTLANNSENLKEVYNDLYSEVETKKQAFDEACENETEALAAFEEAKANLENYGSKTDAYNAALERIDDCKMNLDNLIYALEEKMEADELAGKISDLQMADKKKDIEKQRALVAELSGGETGNEITAKVGGTVSELNVKAGEVAEAGMPIAVIELSDRGYTVGVNVTSEQAKKVSVGDTAEVSTYWWGSQIKAVLKEIKNDAQSGGRNKILIFELSGDIEPGMNVDISIGQRSRNFDAIVPNSAVRSDSNGSFVLVLTTKNSPLGNRYSATRVDVQVIESDDVNSAVSGIGNGEYVITTASAPIESGMLVRMAEG